ncbi:MAG: tetratricopeptide repeat protein [Thiomargarita sp.]|nr:tetratricopeptide repeat protein [Thiomargarita sp.]
MNFLCKNVGVILFTNVFIGCASQLIQNDAVAQETVVSKISVPQIGPFLSLQHEYMYKTLVAENAQLRGYYTLAAEYFYDIAVFTKNKQIAERATQVAEYAQEYNIAMKSAQLWVTLAPDNPYARQILVSMLLREKRIKEAGEHLEVMIDTFKTDAQESVIIAILEQLADQEMSLELIKKLVEKQPNDPLILMMYARLLNHANQLDNSLEVLDTLLSYVPDHVEAVRFYAYLLKKQGKMPQALDWLKQALQQFPDKIEWRLMYARMLTEAKQFKNAITHFKLLASNAPHKNGDFLYALGALSLQIDEFSEAKKYFSALIDNGKVLNTARYYLGQIAQTEQNLDEALVWYHQIDEGINYLNVQAKIAIILVAQGQTTAAIEHLHAVPMMSNHEDRLNLMLLEAELLLEQKRDQEALETYNRLLTLETDNTDVLYMRAMLYEKMGKVAQFEQDLRYILTLKPKNANVLNALGYSLIEHTDRYQEAYDLIKQALLLRPDDYYILDSMGWVLYKQGKYTESITYLRQAYTQRADPEIAAHLGEVLWKQGDYKAAKDIWNIALDIFPLDKKLLEVVHHFLPVKSK